MTHQILGLVGNPMGAAAAVAMQVAEAVATVDKAMAVLEQASVELKAAGITEVGAGDFGASWAGSNLGGHTTKAQTNVITQLDQLAAGLLQYKEDLIASANDMHAADEAAAQPMQTLTALTACVAEDFTTDSGRDLAAQCGPGGND